MDKWIKENQNFLFCRVNISTKSKEEVLAKLSEKYNQIIVSQESATRPHYHILLVHSDSNAKNAQQNLRNFLKSEWKVKGNEDYSITETRKGTLTRLGAYVVKDGNFCQKGFSHEQIEGFKAVSYKKYTKNEFQNQLNIINEEFLTNPRMDIEDYIKKYTELKIAFNQNLNVSNIVNYLNLINAKKNGSSEIISKIKSKFNSL